MEKNILSYADPFYGNGETDRFFDSGLASKWFYIKALCGNTLPHAALPFGKMSVGAYSGAYPGGYGDHYPNSCGGIRKLYGKRVARGFSHIHQSGTGAIGYYYNYAVASPFFGDISRAFEPRKLDREEARPGYYKAILGGILCELTVDSGVALHRYSFGKKGGRVAVDFANDGLAKEFGERFYGRVTEPELRLISDTEAEFSGLFSGVRLYFRILIEGGVLRSGLFLGGEEINRTEAQPTSESYGAFFDISGDRAILRVAFSTLSCERAREELTGSVKSFDEVLRDAECEWEKRLSAFKIDSKSEELKAKFYSNLYHSLIKPADMTGECILGVNGDTVSDLATLWDQYKTVLPLIFMSYADMGEKITRGIVNISRTLGKICCSFGLSDILPCEEQAKMLGVIALCDAYLMGVRGVCPEDIAECIERELSREDFKVFLESGYFERYTHILDTSDALMLAGEIITDADLKGRMEELARAWKNAYSKDGFMSEDSPYYEGDRFNYSFRIQKNMEERIATAGGKERFADMLDGFFGFGKESLKQLTYLGADSEISISNHHRFEGFNNESDMEAPYAYAFTDKCYRLDEIIHECVWRSFGMGASGLPGNNDSGGLSSTFVFNALGIYPASERGVFIIGAPQVKGALVTLSSGKKLSIVTKGAEATEEQTVYVKSVRLNGKVLTSREIPMSDLMDGGALEFELENRKEI